LPEGYIYYYDKKLNESKINMRATRRLLNELIHKRKPKLKSNQSFKDLEITDPVVIANKFCQYFSNIGPNLAKGIRTSISYKHFLPGTFNQSIFLNWLGNGRRNCCCKPISIR